MFTMLNIRKIKQFFLLDIGLPLADLRFNTKAYQTFRQITEMNKWPKDQITTWQDKKLRDLILHFYTNTVYYRRLFDELNIKPSDIKTKADLVKIPPINKDIIRKHYEELIPINIKDIPHKKATTGGSTGKPLKYLLDLKSWSFTTAIKLYSWQTSGYRYGDAYATVGSASLFPSKPSLNHRLYHKFKRSLLIGAMNLSDEKIEYHLQTIQKRKIRYLYGYAAGLFLIARYMNKNGIQIDSIRGCFPTSEMLTKEYRLEMEKAFGFVMDCYGARDGAITAYEITPGYYHVGYNSIAEITNKYDTDTGTLLVTDLLSYSFPFIRYELGDEVTMPDTIPDYSYNGQVITKVIGRTPDIIRLANGHVLTGVGFQVMFGRMNVSAYRISKINDLSLLIEFEPNEKFTQAEEELIRGIFKNHAGDDCEIVMKKVEKFTPNQNGKRHYFMS